MSTFYVLINSVEKVMEFNRIINCYGFDADLVNGRTYVDAKSLVGTFSLPLYKPLEVIAHTDENTVSTLKNELKEFWVEDVKALKE